MAAYFAGISKQLPECGPFELSKLAFCPWPLAWLLPKPCHSPEHALISCSGSEVRADIQSPAEQEYPGPKRALQRGASHTLKGSS